jgi:hypothetical protein
MTGISNSSILAPVPLEHLQAGRAIANATGFVAFGSRKWKLFRKVDELRGSARVPVLIYPWHEDVASKLSFVVSWLGWQVGCEESGNGKYPEGMTHRPPTTVQYTSVNQSHWEVLWHVCNPHELPAAQRLPISAIQTVKGVWRKTAPPRGLELVATPWTLEVPL